MGLVVNSLGPGVVLNLVGMILKPLLPWLKEQAKKSETPLDDWAVDFLELIFGVKGE
jgi:hypothetical protein